MSSYATQMDKSVKTAETVGTLLGPDAHLTEQNLEKSLMLSTINQSDIIINQSNMPENTMSDLIRTVDNALIQMADTSIAATNVLGNKLESLSQGDVSVLPKIVLYIMIGGAILVVGRRFLK